MFLIPKNLKFKKHFKSRLKNYKIINNKSIIGTIFLKAINSGFIHYKQLEAARQSINRKIKKKGKLYSNISLTTSVTKKPLEFRMGKGKGAICYWSFKAYAGCILFQITGISLKKATKAFLAGAAKLPVKTKITFLAQWIEQ
uniref:Ribosomal protein L16 n=1 Tax=Melosira undulata TaxID=2133757 RepID=A0A3G1PWE0_9STRA|nr:ribosomal protein L16 [Melosira undulata]AVR57558.1 ribosomal protein L16 [Melosira undulata]